MAVSPQQERDPGSIAETTQLSRKQVGSVFDALTALVKERQQEGPGRSWSR